MPPRTPPLDERFPRRLLQREIAAAVGVSANAVRAWDCPRNEDGSYDLREVIAWRVADAVARESGPPKGAPVPTGDPEIDALMAAGEGSPALERWRLARAAQEEIKLEQMKQEVLPVDMVRNAYARIAATLRDTGDRLQRLFGAEPFDVFTEGLDEAESIMEKWTEADNAN